MGCNCECHDKLDKIGVHGCCWKCEAEHDSLRNALLQLSEARELLQAGMEWIRVDPSAEEMKRCEIVEQKILDFLGKTDKRKCPSHEYVFSGALGKRICELCGASE